MVCAQGGGDGRGGLRGGGGGRGNLRENREDPAPAVGIAGISLHIAPKGRPLVPPCVYHPRTNALPTRDILRFMFGFRLKAKPEHEAAQVRRWS